VKGHVKQPVCDSHDSLLSNFSLLFTPEKHTLRWQRGGKTLHHELIRCFASVHLGIRQQAIGQCVRLGTRLQYKT
jgi:hypothetical protein